MPLVLIHAQAPRGPIQLRTVESMCELLARGERPAEIVDVGERDPAEVVKVVLRLLPPPIDATGQIPATVEKARISVVEAVSRILATHVAETAPEPGRQPESHGGPITSDREVEPAPAHHVDARTATNDGIQADVRRRPGVEVDVRAIRGGLKLSQPEFAKAFGLKLAVLRDWEKGRTKPEGAARVLLRVIETSPDTVREVVAVDVKTPMV